MNIDDMLREIARRRLLDGYLDLIVPALFPPEMLKHFARERLRKNWTEAKSCSA